MKNRKIKKSRILALSLCCAIAFLWGALESAQADKENVALFAVQETPDVDIMLGKAEMVNIGGNVADVLVANPDIVDVMAVKSNRLYLVGSSLGETNIMALDSDGNVLKKINVHVQMDTRKLEKMIADLYPNESVQVRALTDQVVLTGSVSTPAVANKVSNLVGHYAGEIQELGGRPIDEIIVNMLSVRGEQQVMLRVKIVEAARSALKDLGLEANSPSGASIGEAAVGFATAPALGLSAPTQLAIAALSYSSGDFGNLTFIARALEQEGIINTLAEPNLTSISGEQAGFLAGGEFPIPTSLDRNGNIVYEFRPFGVSLNFRPVVMDENRISLQLTTEVSTTSFEQNLQLNGINVPTFNVRRAETTVELPSGGTLMIAGLIKSDSISGLTQLPGVGDIPVVGDLIKSDTFRRSESEVVVMITPFLVKPFAHNQAAPVAVDTHKVTQVGPDMSYGALQPEGDELPRLPEQPHKQPNQLSNAFGENIRRLYDKKAPDGLMMDSGSGFGYVLD